MPGDNITIRPATVDDQHAIKRLVHDARLSLNGLDWRRSVVADEDGRIVGCAQLKIHRHGTRELHVLAVEPERRRAGIGSQLVEALLDQDAGGQARGPKPLWTRRGAQYHRSQAGAGRRSRDRAPERDETRHGMTADDDSIVEAALGEAADSPPVPADTVAEPDDLLSELSRAMHTAAGSQHVRIADELERQRTAQVESLKARAGSEAKALKKTSEQDIDEVDAWAKTATEVIAGERVRRIDARREQLQADLQRQDVIVEREVQAIEAAVEAHRAELDAFFSQLERESDPAGIAHLASSLPSLPSLTDAADAARRQATAGFALLEEPPDGPESRDGSTDDTVEVSTSRLMAVMASEGPSGGGVDVARPWEPAPRAVAVPAGVGATAADSNEANEPTAAVREGSNALLRTVPSTRPMDRLRGWNRKPDDAPDRER